VSSKKKRTQKQSRETSGLAAQSLPSSNSTATTTLSPQRKWLFRILALVIVPAILFGSVEISLRLLGHGHSTSFFIETQDEKGVKITENRHFSRPYFAPELLRIPKPVSFEPSLRNNVRVFVFGESAAEGDPAPAFGFARILQVMLRQQLGTERIEVINTAVTAINSHVIRNIASDAAKYPAHIWVIYMGNNEVVGPFGSGTVFGPQTPGTWLIRGSTAVKTTRTGQLLDDFIHNISKPEVQAWGGMEMFLGQQVRMDDPQMAAVYRHFEKNLSSIIGSGANIVLSTVGSNLRDCPPFASLHRKDLESSQLAEWERMFVEGKVLESAGKPAEAIAQYERALQLDDTFAELHFRLARCFVSLDRHDLAGRHFTLARDLDALRFRADSRINEIIRNIAHKWETKNVRLADGAAALANESRDGIPGREWFYEHVHMTFEGNYIIAREIARQVTNFFPHPFEQRPFLTMQECAQRLGLTACERLRMADEMSRRISRPPFTQQLDHAAEMERWTNVLSDLRQRDQEEFPLSAEIYRHALTNKPYDWQLHDNFAGASIQHGDATNAIAHWQHVTELLPHRVETYDLLAATLLDHGRLDEAFVQFEKALRIRPDFANAHIGLGRVELAKDQSAKAIEHFQTAVKLQPRSPAARNHLGLGLLKAGKNTEAESAFREAMQIEPGFMPARLNLSSALRAQGREPEAIANYEELIRNDSKNTAARRELAKAYARQDRMDQALRQYSEIVRQQPEDFDAHYTRATTLVRMSRLDEAAEQFKDALRLRPDSHEAHLNYGTILARSGNSAEARAHFEEAVRLKPEFIPARMNLAVALTQENRLDDAVLHLREALRLDPGNLNAQKLLETALKRQTP
jgi:tetratricopeptide (TPR) repeat protein